MTTAPTDRYPGRSGPVQSRRQKIVVYVLAVAFAIGAAAFVQQRFGSGTPVTGEETGFELVDDSSVLVRFDVTRDDPSVPAYCIVRARSLDGSESGRREVYVPPSQDSLAGYETTVRTTQPPVLGDVFGCGLDVPEYLRP